MKKTEKKAEKKAEKTSNPPSTETSAPARTETPASGDDVIVGLKKYDFYGHRSTGSNDTETDMSAPLQQSYEDIQRNAKGPGSEEWRALDRHRADLSETYRDLAAEEKYSPEYKSETAWRRYAEAKAEIERLAPEARQKMLGSAERAEQFSIPVPPGESLATEDVSRLLLTSNARDRIERLISREKETSARGPFKADPADVLKAEYARGLSQGGPGGGAAVRAVYELARDWGLDLDRVVGDARQPSHHGSLRDAAAARARAQMVSTRVPEPPFENPLAAGASRRRSAPSEPRRKPAFMAGGDGRHPIFSRRSRPSWK